MTTINVNEVALGTATRYDTGCHIGSTTRHRRIVVVEGQRALVAR